MGQQICRQGDPRVQQGAFSDPLALLDNRCEAVWDLGLDLVCGDPDLEPGFEVEIGQVLF